MRLGPIFTLCVALSAPTTGIAQTYMDSSNAIGTNSLGVLTSSYAGPINGFAGNHDFRPGGGNLLERDFIKARNFVAEGRYAEAEPVLNMLIGRTSAPQVRFLKGVTMLGLGDPAAARRYLEPASRTGHPGALSGLALAQIQLGNQDAAQKILGSLRSRLEKCGGMCADSKSLRQAITVVEKGLV
ncbi:tetratricopeptide repeat protein [Sphingobium sp.]|jgi:hypothetical protein|uniref:tetratricopeptide repeat protein n=1 Tax=Sphingobium sp. TaxID=1912891 RepID=UPI00257FDCEF|nr:tetratricopeptide repeat protein [Sphingobium sp.]MBR2267415.1 tetratricopeptide repeat protein [Sphingobium sp.]